MVICIFIINIILGCYCSPLILAPVEGRGGGGGSFRPPVMCSQIFAKNALSTTPYLNTKLFLKACK